MPNNLGTACVPSGGGSDAGVPDSGSDPAGERVEGPAVPDAPGTGQPPNQPDDVMGGGARRLVDDQHAVGPGVVGRSTLPHRWTAATSRSASARARTRASSIGASMVAPAARA